jgi:hypothetical protein
MATMDIYMIYQFIRKLVTPFTEMPAYHAGLIDANGKFLKQRAQFTPAEQNICTYFDILIINLKRLIALVPGGKSRLANYAAALFLTRTYESYEQNPHNVLFNLEEEFNKTLQEVYELYEDAPANSASGAGIALGAKAGEGPIVNPAAARKYKGGNMKYSLKLLRRKASTLTPLKHVAQTGLKETTLEYHGELNPKLWQDNKLNPEVRGKLIQIADTWMKFAKIDKSSVYDIIITGGNVNYNYTPLSDIDLHLVISRDSMNPDRNFVDEYLQDKKILWTLTHPDISIYGYPVELYAQDVQETPHKDQGVYSIMNDAWIQEPQRLGLEFSGDDHLENKVQFYKDMIDNLISNNADDDAIDAVKKKIKNMRGDSIGKDGEFAFGNLVFKDLRNSGYLDKMDDYEKSRRDKALSLS